MIFHGPVGMVAMWSSTLSPWIVLATFEPMLLYEWLGMSHVMIGRVRAKLQYEWPGTSPRLLFWPCLSP
jgi:hypothetical protein